MPASGPVADRGDPVAKSPYQDLLTFCLRPALGADASVALALTTQFRRAVISRIALDVPSAVHGHEPDGPHVSWLALPFAAHAQASGRVLGVGVAIPTGMPDAHRSRLLRALIGSVEQDPMTELKLPKPLTTAGSVGISRWSQGDPWAASPWRWIGPSRRWATITPVVWDRFTRDESDPEKELRESLAHGGYPDPAPGALAWSRTPFVRGAAQPRPHQVRREGEPTRPFRHVLVEFPTKVRGPVAVGRLRHFGVGLFVPMDRDAAS